MARSKAKSENTDAVDALPAVTLSGAVPAVLSEAVEGHRWQNRMSRADVVKEALTEWAEKRELLDGARERLSKQISEDSPDE